MRLVVPSMLVAAALMAAAVNLLAPAAADTGLIATDPPDELASNPLLAGSEEAMDTAGALHFRVFGELVPEWSVTAFDNAHELEAVGRADTGAR